MIEIAGEAVLLMVVTVFFAFVIAESTGLIGAGPWPIGASLTPWISVGIGTPFLIARIVHVARAILWVEGAIQATQAEIMDVGFMVSDDPQADRRRFVRILAAIGVLYVGIWLFGFHVTLPLWVAGYLYLYGNVGARWAIGTGLFFICFIIGVYDYLMEVPWEEPVIVRLFT